MKGNTTGANGANETKTAKGNKGNGNKGNKGNAQQPAAKTDGQPAASADGEGDKAPAAAPKKAVIKIVPKKVRQGGRGGGRSAAITYNIAECPYNLLSSKKADDAGKDDKAEKTNLHYILNGAWVPAWNGMPDMDADETQPVYNSIEEAHAAGAVSFAFITMDDGVTEMPKLYSYLSNVNNVKNNGLNAVLSSGSPAIAEAIKLAAQKGRNEGEAAWKWKGFITASAENAEQVAANLEAYINSPYADKSIVEAVKMLPAPYKLTVSAPATVGTAKTTAVATAELAEA